MEVIIMRRVRKKNRLGQYDYSQNGMYYVTICTYRKYNYFGRIVKGQMILNERGQLARKLWLEIPTHYQGIDIDEFVVMPNHIHGIIYIHNNVVTEHCSVTTGNHRCGLLSKIIKSYKEMFVKGIKGNFGDYDFHWQRSYYDHVIRSGYSLDKIREYILLNPANWEKDKNKVESIDKILI